MRSDGTALSLSESIENFYKAARDWSTGYAVIETENGVAFIGKDEYDVFLAQPATLTVSADD